MKKFFNKPYIKISDFEDSAILTSSGTNYDKIKDSVPDDITKYMALSEIDICW